MEDIFNSVSASIEDINNNLQGNVEPVTLIESHCGDGTSTGEMIHSYSQKLVIMIWMLPALLGPFTGEVIILYMGLCNIPHYFIYHLLSNYIQERRPYNCGNPDYMTDFASPCFETMVSWNFTVFLITHTLLRKMTRLRDFSKFNIRAIGRTLLVWSIFVTIGVVYTKNNTWNQSILGSMVGAIYGMGSAVYLEFYWKDYIPYILTTPPFSWLSYVDSVYNSLPKKCKCKKKNCKHKMNKAVYEMFSHSVYSNKTYSSHDSSSTQYDHINISTGSNISCSSNEYMVNIEQDIDQIPLDDDKSATIN